MGFRLESRNQYSVNHRFSRVGSNLPGLSTLPMYLLLMYSCYRHWRYLDCRSSVRQTTQDSKFETQALVRQETNRIKNYIITLPTERMLRAPLFRHPGPLFFFLFCTFLFRGRERATNEIASVCDVIGNYFNLHFCVLCTGTKRWISLSPVVMYVCMAVGFNGYSAIPGFPSTYGVLVVDLKY